MTKAAFRSADDRLLGHARRRLLEWYDKHRRDLPWRRTRDPYAIWISETMLQQTRVDTVIPYYESFIERFPDVHTLAKANIEDIYGAWTGLGYYSRARNLQHAAQTIVADHAGELPEEADALRSLKGIGRYTAGAVASIAFDRPEPIVDGNVMRVLARFLDIHEDIAASATIERFWQLAATLARGPRPGDLNQAVMELGATVCTPRSPQCLLCPLGSRCEATKSGDPEALPIKTKKRKPKRLDEVAAWLTRGDRVLAVKRPEGGLLGGLWQLPGGAVANPADPIGSLERAIRESVGLCFSTAEPAGKIEHIFTHRHLHLHVYRCVDVTGRVRRHGFDEHRWLAPEALASLPHGGPTRKALALLGEASHETHRQRMRRSTEQT
jgi:A/G-specific adenine glycosylase